MSHQITLNSWFGSDPSLAADKMAKVFKLSMEQGETILKQLQDGGGWRFAQKISDHQAGPAAAYLQRLGFQVDLKSLNSEHENQMDLAFRADDGTADNSGTEPQGDGPFAFTGKGGQLFGIWFVNWVKTIFTLGIYRFWAKTRVRNFIWSNTTFAGDSFSYHGTGKELFRGFMKISPFLLAFIGLIVGIQFYGGAWAEPLISLVQIALSLFIPFLMVRAWRYRLSRTAWRGIHFSFRGEGKEALKVYAKGALLTLLTLGLYSPYFLVQAENFWRGNSYFGTLQGKFTGNGKDLFWRHVLAIFLTIITLGIYALWYQAYLQRYYWAHTHFGEARFRFTATGGEWFVLYLVNTLLFLFTLGFGYSWVVVRNQKFFVEHLTLVGDMDLDSVTQEMKESGAMGEAAADVFDVPVDIG